jgi:hypothetical protein
MTTNKTPDSLAMVGVEGLLDLYLYNPITSNIKGSKNSKKQQVEKKRVYVGDLIPETEQLAVPEEFLDLTEENLINMFEGNLSQGHP